MKRAWAVCLGVASVACGPVRSPGPVAHPNHEVEARAPTPTVVPCPTARAIVLRRPRSDGGIDVVRLTCEGDVATALSTSEYPPSNDDSAIDAAPPTPERISADAFGQVWTTGLDLVRKGLCVAPTAAGKTTPSFTFENAVTGVARVCGMQGVPWTRMAAEAQALVPPFPTDASPSWPPSNDLWKDELRYYGSAARR